MRPSALERACRMGRAGRLYLLTVLFLAAWAVLVGRAVQIQLVEHGRWAARGDAARSAIRPIPANRGTIRSADGVVLAHSVANRSLGVDPKMVQDPEALASALDSLDLVEAPALRRALLRNQDRRFFWVSRELLSEMRLEGLLERFPCLSAPPESKRLYPLGRAASIVVGLVGRDDHGLSGLEADFANVLQGKSGRILSVRDATGKKFDGLDTKVLEEPEVGMNLSLTLESRMQEIAAAELRAGIEQEGAVGGFVIVTRPSTGEILALAGEPCPDPLDPRTWKPDSTRIRAVTDAFEPGSVYKAVAFAAALDARSLRPDDVINCMGGTRSLAGGGTITDHEPYGALTATEVMAHSSNIGTGVIAERAGAERFYRMEKALGFGLPTGVQLPAEARGRIPEPGAWSGRSLITQCFGQEVSVTGIQIAMAYGAIANGGELMRPLLVRDVTRSDGSAVEHWEPEVVRRAMKPETSRALRDMLRAVVTDGTGKKAEVAGFPVGGKTSTAQKYIAAEKSYSSRRYIAGFVGMAPIERPELLCIVFVDEPGGDYYGGNVAAPIFQRIMAGLRPLLQREGEGLPVIPALALDATPPAERKPTVPSLIGLTGGAARRVLESNGMMPRFSGEGERVVAVHPSVGSELAAGGVVTVTLGEGELAEATSALPMPDLRGLALRDLMLRLNALDTRAEIRGSGWVLEQEPAPGEPLALGTACRITLGPDSCRALGEYRTGGDRAASEPDRLDRDAYAAR